ncbi:MAG: hypothetical protein GXP15_03855 [Gammaproteobacteria bacterium]|nr:hypothetical protein [Gammaproteobacteria bacterium]
MKPEIKRLCRLRASFRTDDSLEKLQLLRQIPDIELRSSREVQKLHSTLCFLRAFPDTAAHYRAAHALLLDFERRIRKLSVGERTKLWDTGIAGTPMHYPFSFEMACWLAGKTPGTVAIDWDELDDTAGLDELLEHLLLPPETDYFDSGLVSSQEWIELAAGTRGGGNFDWLLAQLRKARWVSVWTRLYNAAELPLAWNLGSTPYSKSLNIAPHAAISPRKDGLRKNVVAPKAEIMRPLERLEQVSTRKGTRLIDVAMASLAVRHRETFHFNYANPQEVYVADTGHGISIAVFGLRPEYRYPLECTMGYLIVSNGSPIGYGGASAVFHQVNTGVNIFDEYRGSEAAYLWVQVMRVYHHLFGCTRFIANAFQFGGDNAEALQSGAFWFYYRLGYRPVRTAVRELAQREARRIRRNRSYRCNLPVLRRLASCDMHLTLPGARKSELFKEHWIETSSMLATRELAAARAATRQASADHVAKRVARELGIRSMNDWSVNERRAYRQLAPIVATTGPASWPAAEKRSMRTLLRAKGGLTEATYARQLCEHSHFLATLRSRCQSEDKR